MGALKGIRRETAIIALPVILSVILLAVLTSHQINSGWFLTSLGTLLVIATVILSFQSFRTKKKEIADYNEMQKLIYVDSLTGLPNRRKAQEVLIEALSSSGSASQYGALIFIDMDNFKCVNDTHGHDIGDAVLIEVARRIREFAEPRGMAARINGDEFIILIENIGKTEEVATKTAEDIGNDIIFSFMHSIALDGKEISITPSIGITIFHGEKKSPKELLKEADAAMRESKVGGKNRFSFFTVEMTQKIDMRIEIENNLRKAIHGDGMELYFQPIVNQDGLLHGAEALLRWNLKGKIVSPLDFIPIAEETGTIVPIGAWILKSACDCIRKWGDGGILSKDFALSVNVSAVHLGRSNFIETVSSIVVESGINPSRIKIEITESSIIRNIDDAILKINALRQAGIEVVMDDFGTGHSSLSCLRRLPISQIKIDKSFVDNMEHDWDDEAIVRIILNLARTLRLSVIAEGVENERQYLMLKTAGCSFFQGYHFDKPMPAREFERLLSGRDTARTPVASAPCIPVMDGEALRRKKR